MRIYFYTIIFVFMSLSGFNEAFANEPYDWQSFTQLNGIRAMKYSTDNQQIWCATEGGVLRFNSLNGTYEKWTNTDGVLSNNLQSIEITATGEVWFGSVGAGIVKYTPHLDRWDSYPVSFRNGIGSVLNILALSGKLWFATQNAGVHILKEGNDPGDYIDDTWEVYNTGLGLSSNQIRALYAAANGDLWFGSDKGISIRRKATGGWDYLTTFNSSLSNNVINCIGGDRSGRIWIGTAAGLNYVNNGAINIVNGPPREIRSVCFIDTLAFAATNAGIFRYNANNFKLISSDRWSCYAILTDAANHIWAAIDGLGLARWDVAQETWQEFPINSPAHKSFTHVALDHTGQIWASTGLRPTGPDQGLNKLNPATGSWTVYNKDNSPLPMNRTMGLAVDSQNRKFIGTYNSPGGITIISPDETSWRVFTPSNSNLSSSNILELFLDSQSAVWMNSYGSGIDVLKISGSDTTLVNFTTNEPTGGLASAFTLSLAEYNGGMLIGHFRLNSVDYLDYGASLLNKQDDRWYHLEIPSTFNILEVRTIAVDKTKSVWFGFDIGVGRFKGSGISDWTNPDKWDDSSVLRSKVINHIFVDRNNNKWFATDGEGLYYFINNSAQFVHFSIDNSGLPDNTVYWVAEDTAAENLVLWIGTSRGLSRFEILDDTVNPTPNGQIYAYPNPVNAALEHRYVTFQNIPENALVSIFTLAGDLIKQWDFRFGSNDLRDGALEWDLKNSDGKRIAPGIYFFTVSSVELGSIVGKFAVIR